MESSEEASQPPLSLHRFTPLPSERYFRLIRIKRGLHRVTKVVQVEVVEAEIDSPPKYNALSYAWGSPNSDSFVVCCGCAIPVTANCQRALQRLRKCDPGQLLFVDAICINQNSTAEKNHQVAAMGDIYANAQKVICWIQDHSHRLNDRIPRINHAIFCMFESWGRWTNPLSHFFWSRSYQEFLFDASLNLASSDWSERVWTGEGSVTISQVGTVITKLVQEFALGKEIYLQFGSHRYLYKDIYHLLEGTSGCARAIPEIKDAFHSHEGARRAILQTPPTQTTMNGDLHDKGSMGLDPSTIMSLILGNRSKLTWEPKDKIFSLFSVFQRGGTHILKPDYERSLEDISCEAVSSLVERGCNLQFLESSCSPEPWPSWVPDISQQLYKRQAPGKFSDFDMEKPDCQTQERALRVRCAARVEQVVRVSAACPRLDSPRLSEVLAEFHFSGREGQGPEFKSSPILMDFTWIHLMYFDFVRKFLVGVAELWNDDQFRALPVDDRFPPEKRPSNARVISMTLLRHLSYTIRRSGSLYCLLDAVVKAVPHFLWVMMDGLAILEGIDAKHYQPSWRLAPLAERCATLSNWDILVYLDNDSPYLSFSPYDHLREAFSGSRGFATASGFCGFVDEAVQEGDLMVRIMGTSTLMIVRPAENNTYRLISPVDVDYDTLLPEIQSRWKDEGEWFTFS